MNLRAGWSEGDVRVDAAASPPTTVRFCTRCVISNQRPVASREYSRTPGSAPGRIAFDADVCGACRVAEMKQRIDWTAREAELRDLLGRYRRDDGHPDVLVPGSGGKDSIFAAHILKYRYGMHPLTVTWAPHLYTDVGWRNFQAWLRAGFDNLLVTPNPRVHALLTRLAFLNLLHPFQPFVLGQRSLAPKLAERFNIPLVFYGEDDSEYEGTAHTEDWGRPEFWQTTTDSLFFGGASIADLMSKFELTRHDLALYMPKPRTAFPVSVRALGYYIRWQPQEAYYYAVEHAGFEANTERTEGTYSKYNSIDDKLDGLHYYTTYIKFGLGRASYDAAQEIRNGHLTREEGVALVHRFDGEKPTKYLAECLEYMGLSEMEFNDTLDRFRPDALWTKVGEEWRLKATVE
jgi:N-acetyl sugar amidotransferase